MTLEELKTKVPASLLPAVNEYGPALIKMTGDELFAWINQMAAGRDYDAYETLLRSMTNAERLTEWGTLNAEFKAANATNAQRVKLQRDAMNAILRTALTVALAMVGL